MKTAFKELSAELAADTSAENILIHSDWWNHAILKQKAAQRKESSLEWILLHEELMCQTQPGALRPDLS